MDKIDLRYYGDYRIGLTGKEIKEYLKNRANTTKLGNLYRRFVKIAGVNTMGIAPNGESLMYRHDVERFADVLFLNKPTYFD